MTLQAGRIYGGVGRLGAARQGGATPWWLSGGISAANCVAAYQPKGAASLAASYTNLANPGTYNAAPGVAPTWDAVNGWKFSTGQYLVAVIHPRDHWSALIRVSDVRAVTNALFGVRGTTTDNNRFGIISTGSERQYHHGAAGSLFGAKISSGIVGVVDHQGYANGVADGLPTGAWGTDQSAYSMYIGAFNLAGTLYGADTKYIQAFAIYNTAISAAQVAALTAAMAAL